MIDDDYAAGEVAPLTSSGLEQLRVSIAHELFHAIQIGESRGHLPEWLAEATAVWMEGRIAPPDVDREVYRVALGGAGTEQPYWRTGGLHEYGAWWLIAELERERAGFVRRLLTLAAARGEDDPDGLLLLARAFGGRSALEAAFVRFARTAVDDPLVGPALRARRTQRLGPGGRLVLRATRAAAQLPPPGACRPASARDRAPQRRTPDSRGRAPREGRAGRSAPRLPRVDGRAGSAARAARRAARATRKDVRLTLTA